MTHWREPLDRSENIYGYPCLGFRHCSCVVGGMKDRYGFPVLVGWHDFEILWVEAALTLPKIERSAAYRDIASMSGRTFQAIQCKAQMIASQKRFDEAVARMVPRRIMVPAIAVHGPKPRVKAA